ncbi:KamA family radical SAM protein [Salibacter halophilus]|uniref:Lysine 2,3-aminomutase n=1 Tax=Salibacter halophilus TaxID=1803916 RepID=A0A6N6M6T5_9FLAO|nr:lysine 2,3-aminomutase [Salibacter halophilus]KAB1065508.1 lysine 2,3-aminomutase [Salibacter halophilus]
MKQERYRTFGVNNFRKVPQVEEYLTEEQRFAIEVVGNVLPFKVNNYVIDQLIDWENVPDDPIFILTFPQKDMLSDEHFSKVAEALKSEMPKKELKELVNDIRMDLNPHPAGQMEMNVPEINGYKLTGIQHKYRETMLFFPNQGQTCHAYCTFCFRWPQFVGIDELKFAMKETDLMIEYLKAHPEVTDVLFTGGDPMIMSTKRLERYILPLIEADLPNLKTIRIGSKALGYWPYRFTTDRDAQPLLDLFKKVEDAGVHLAFMGHFNHPNELKTDAVKEAVKNLREVGVQIRTQSPIMRNINDSSDAWAEMWRKQVDLGMIPYYMFIARDTGAQDYFAVPLVRTWEIFKGAYEKVSGICRTVRGPSMSAEPGKVQILGETEVAGKRVLGLRFIQGRNHKWVHKPFFAEYDEDAVWLDDLKPAFEDQFFYEEEYEQIKNGKMEEAKETEEVPA